MDLIFPVWICISVPILAAFYILGIFFKNGQFFKNKTMAKYYVLPKCAGSYVCVSGAALALVYRGDNLWTSLLLWALVLCMAGDFLIELHLLAGAVSFGIGHCMMMLYLLSSYPFHFSSIILWFLGVSLIIFMFHKNIPSMGSLLFPFLIYISVLIGGFSLAIPAIRTKEPRSFVLTAGLLCFVISDVLLGKRHFGARQPWISRVLMFLYYMALYLIQISLWL